MLYSSNIVRPKNLFRSLSCGINGENKFFELKNRNQAHLKNGIIRIPKTSHNVEIMIDIISTTFLALLGNLVYFKRILSILKINAGISNLRI